MDSTDSFPGLDFAIPFPWWCLACSSLCPFCIVEYISGKVFFTTSSDLNMLKKLKSAERLFLLIKKQSPFTVSSPRKGKILNEIQKLINDDPGSWLDTISVWKNLLELDTKKEKLSQRASNPLKRKMGENEIIAKKLKVEEMQKIETTHKECQLEKQIKENALEQRDSVTGKETLQEERSVDAHNQDDLTFRVSCRCSGTIGKAFTAQEIGRVIGIALMKQFGWKTDLRTPNLEVMNILFNLYTYDLFLSYFSVVKIHVSSFLCRIPLASRTYIKTAGLRSTIAWAMASLAEIKPGAFVLDPMCGLGTILLEAAKEWPSAYYMGADVSDSQLLGTCDNLKAAGLKDKIELLKVSVIELPLPSDSVDIIISDIPFGKKFKLGKDIKSILQEMERVLHVGGTIVLLLNEDHHRLLKDYREGNSPLNSKGSHTHEPEIKKCLNPEENTGTSEMVPSSHETSNNACLNKMSPFGSLVPVEYYKVSLGKTEAFICKYKKSHSSGL
uniref:THUMP domain containing 2 n=1 Tax=Spermophilus dauricus TaxID=99837 RepID=A0A8C9ULZ4_SPEDA